MIEKDFSVFVCLEDLKAAAAFRGFASPGDDHASKRNRVRKG